jgi:WD40 repeat protein
MPLHRPLALTLLVALLPRPAAAGPPPYRPAMRPSPLDGLDAAAIPPHERVPGQPPELVAVLGTHRGAAWEGLGDVVWSPDGKRIASRRYLYGVVRLWRAEGLEDQGSLGGGLGSRLMVFSPDGRFFAFTDGIIVGVHLWDLSGEQPVEKASLDDVLTNPLHNPGPGEPGYLRRMSSTPHVEALAFSPDGRKLAVAGDNGVVRVWGLDGPMPEEIAALLPEPSDFSWLGLVLGCCLACGALLAGKAAAHFMGWDLLGPEAARTAPNDGPWWASVLVPLGVLAVSTFGFWWCSPDSNLRLLSVVACGFLLYAGVARDCDLLRVPHPDGRPRSRLYTFFVWAAVAWSVGLVTHVLLAPFSSGPAAPKSGPVSEGPVDLAFTADGTALVWGQGRRERWDFTQSAEYDRRPGSWDRWRGVSARRLLVAASILGAGLLLAVVWGRRRGWAAVSVSVAGLAGGLLAWLPAWWDLAPPSRAEAEVAERGAVARVEGDDLVLFDTDGKSERARGKATGPLGSAAVSPDGTRVLTTYGNQLDLWKVVGDRLERLPVPGRRSPALQVLHLGPDGELTTFDGFGAGQVCRWGLTGPGARLLSESAGLPGRPEVLAVGPGGAALVAFHDDNRTRLWDLRGGAPRERAVLGEMEAWDDSPPRCCFSPDGSRLALVHDMRFFMRTHPVREAWERAQARRGRKRTETEPSAGTVGLWLFDLTPDQPRRSARLSGDGEHPVTFAFSPDGSTLAALFMKQDVDTREVHRHIQFWDVTGAAPAPRADMPFLPHEPGALAFARDGMRLFAVCNDRTDLTWIASWPLAGPGPPEEDFSETVKEVGFHPRLAVSPDGAVLAAWGPYCSRVELFQADRKALRTIEMPGPVGRVVFAADGRHLLTENHNGTVYVLRLWPYDDEAALADCDAALKRDPKDADALLGRGRAHRLAGRPDQAVADLSEALRLRPGSARAHYERGLAHADRGDYARAKKDLDEAIRLDPTFAAAPKGK